MPRPKSIEKEKNAPLSKDMLLSDDLVDRTRPHARGKRFCVSAGHSVKTYQLGMKPFTPLRIS